MDFSNQKRILVTGGAGFVGSHLCERLLNSDNEVLCLDNYFSGAKQNVLHLLDNPRFKLMRHDVTLPLYEEVDEIYNLACPASPIHYKKTRLRRPRPACRVRSICWIWQDEPMRGFCKPQQVRSTAIRKFTRNRKVTGVTSIRSESGHAMMRESAALKPLGLFFVRVGLVAVERQKSGREGEKYKMQDIKLLFLKELTQAVGTPVRYAPWMVKDTSAASAASSRPLQQASAAPPCVTPPLHWWQHSRTTPRPHG